MKEFKKGRFTLKIGTGLEEKHEKKSTSHSEDLKTVLNLGFLKIKVSK